MIINLILCSPVLSQFPKFTVRGMVQRPRELLSPSASLGTGMHAWGTSQLWAPDTVRSLEEGSHWSSGINQFLHLPVAYEGAGTLVSFHPCGEGLCALTNRSCQHLASMFVSANTPPSRCSSTKGCMPRVQRLTHKKVPPGASWPRHGALWIAVAWLSILGAEGNCQALSHCTKYRLSAADT